MQMCFSVNNLFRVASFNPDVSIDFPIEKEKEKRKRKQKETLRSYVARRRYYREKRKD